MALQALSALLGGGARRAGWGIHLPSSTPHIFLSSPLTHQVNPDETLGILPLHLRRKPLQRWILHITFAAET